MRTRRQLPIAALLALSMAGMGPSHRTYAASQQIADCTFATLQTDLQAGGDYYYAVGQCPNPIVFTSIVSASNNASLTAQGNDVTLDGGKTVRFFSVHSLFALTGLTLTDGSSSAGGAIFNDGTLSITNSTLSYNASTVLGGGAINNLNGTVTITNSTLSDNSAPQDYGGAIDNTGTLTITGSTVSGNSSAKSGGAIENNQGATATITNSTLSGNKASSAGGAIDNYRMTLRIIGSTVAGNTAVGGYGGAIENIGGSVDVGRTILAKNTGGNCSSDSTPTDGGYNLEDDQGAGCGFSPANHDIVGQDPLLGPLANNGGPTETEALQSGSPAIDAIPTSSGLCSSTDQRGYVRPDDNENVCDIGAYESGVFGFCPTSETNLQSLIGSAGSGGTVTLYCSSAITISFVSTITITQSVTLDASKSPGTVTLAGPGQLFHVQSGVSFGLTGLTLSQASANTGGAIDNQGATTITDSTVSGNSAPTGGAVYNTGTLTITDSTLSGNSSSYGGAVYNQGTLSVTSSTFASNSSYYGGGAINNDGTVTITSSTLASNSGSPGGAILNNGTLTVGGTLIANNGRSNCYSSVGTTTDTGHNLESGSDCGFTGTGDMQNTNPNLGPLQNNGGPTQTMALKPGSPAIDHIPTSSGLCPATDQRGAARSDEGESFCDIGAYENVDPTSVTASPVARFTATRTARGMSFRWRMVTNRDLAGFTLAAVGRLLTPLVLLPHAARDYRYTNPVTVYGPYTLTVRFADGHTAQVTTR